MTEMEKGMMKTLVSEEELRDRIRELGRQVSEGYRGKDLLLVTVLKGAVVFLADFMRALDCHCEIDFMVASSFYGSAQSNGVLKLVKDLDVPIEGRDVLIVEDILDSGVTLHNLMKLLTQRNPASIEICTLFSKPSRRKVEVPVRYMGFEIPDAFIVGYGLDYDEKYRNLPYVGILKEEVYTK